MPRPPLWRLTVVLSPEIRQHLEGRGARENQRKGPYSYGSHVDRTVSFYEALILLSDPRETQGMSQRLYDFVVGLLDIADPLPLETFHVEQLGTYLASLPTSRTRARKEGVDLAEIEAIDPYPYAEKQHLVDAALTRVARRQPSPASKRAD